MSSHVSCCEDYGVRQEVSHPLGLNAILESKAFQNSTRIDGISLVWNALRVRWVHAAIIAV